MAKGIKYFQPPPKPRKTPIPNTLSELEIEAKNKETMQILEEYYGVKKISPIKNPDVVTKSINPPASTPLVDVGKPVKRSAGAPGAPGAKAERKAQKMEAYLASRKPEQIAQAQANEARRAADSAANAAERLLSPEQRSTLITGRVLRKADRKERKKLRKFIL